MAATHHDRLADVADLLIGEMGSGESGGGCGEAVPGDVSEVQVCCGEHPHHAGRVDRARVDRRDSGMRLDAADKGQMDGPGRCEVGDITTSTGDQAQVFQPE